MTSSSTLVLDGQPTGDTNHSAERIRRSLSAMKLSFTWFGTRKALSAEQRAQAADTFGAAEKFLSAGKKLLDTSATSYRAVTNVRGRISSYFKGMSLPYPEPGIRLIRQSDLECIHRQMSEYQDELRESVGRLDEEFDELKRLARSRLGNLFSAADYPTSLRGLFDVSWEFPSVEPPDYLRRLSPQLYSAECSRVTERFNEAIRLAEAAFMEELSQLLEHLTERLSGSEDGKPKVFRDGVVENLQEFFGRFQRLNVQSNAELDELVARAREVLQGVKPGSLRDSQQLRHKVAANLSVVQSQLDQLLVERPRRRLERTPRGPANGNRD